MFVTLSVNNYYYTITTADFINGAPYNLTDSTSVMDEFYNYHDGIQKKAASWERLSNRECIQAYSNLFLTSRRNLVLVSSDRNETNSVLEWGSAELDGGDLSNNWWICSTKQNGGNVICQPEDYISKADDWTVWGYPIDYCLSEPVQDICAVEFSMEIMLVVIVFNLIKIFAMTWVLLRYNAEEILTTVGDSVVSFLTKDDETTRGMCLVGWRDIGHYWQYPGTGIVYHPLRRRWAVAVSRGKWCLFTLLMFASFALITVFGGWGFAHTKKRGNSLSFSSLWNLGFGAAHQDAIVIYDDVDSLIGMAFLANIPQIFLAAIWLLYMGIMTSMFLAADWSIFGIKGHPLMVKNARGEQRGMWLLGAPLVWGAPLLVLQIILHWLISQSIFVISLNIHNPDGSPNQGRPYYRNCGYSPIAIIFTIVATILLMLSAMLMACRKLPSAAPVVATCSAAISAACHLPNGLLQQGSWYKPMRWGQCGRPYYGVGHCALMPEESFKNGYGQSPVPGWSYS